MIRRPLLTAALTALLAVPAAAQAPSPAPPAPPAASTPANPAAPASTATPLLVPPALPDPVALAALPPIDLAQGYLAAVNALPYAQQAAQGQGVLHIGIDGQPYDVNSANAAQFITFLQARMDAFSKAITARTSPPLDGKYTLAASLGCTGEKFDPRLIFSPGRGSDGKLLPIATGAEIVQSGAETDLLVTLSSNRQQIGIVLAGTAVENNVVFSDVLSMGYALYGTINGATINLKLDPDEVKQALGAQAGTAADWDRLKGCIFTLTKM